MTSFHATSYQAQFIILSMEPILVTAPELRGIEEELIIREPIFHRPEQWSTRADFEQLMTDDYWEVGASGKCYSRAYILGILSARLAAPGPDIWETSGFHCRRLGENVYLLTYTLLQNHVRRTRRSTIWLRTPESWKIVFHQGTIVQE
jgi:hypothetical protein